MFLLWGPTSLSFPVNIRGVYLGAEWRTRNELLLSLFLIIKLRLLLIRF